MYMDVKIKLNGKLIIDSVDQDMVLLDFCRKHNCFSVKRGCESGNCGLCTVLLDGKPVLSCSMPIGRADGRAVDTLEGLEEEAKQFTGFFAAQGADQCGFQALIKLGLVPYGKIVEINKNDPTLTFNTIGRHISPGPHRR